MTINSNWLNKEEFTLADIAYLSCGIEPKDSSIPMPPIVLDAFNKLKKSNSIDQSLYRQGKIDIGVGYDFKGTTVYYNKDQAISLIDELGVQNCLKDMNEYSPLDKSQNESDNNNCQDMNLPPYLDTSHPMYSKELSITIKAWMEVLNCEPAKPKRGSRKKLISDWLNKNYTKKDLTASAKERITTMINPDANGGAPGSGNKT